MIRLNRKLLQPPAINLARLAQQCLQTKGNLTSEHTLTVLGNKNDMVAQLVRGMRSYPVAAGLLVWFVTRTVAWLLHALL